jgi:uncharacterized protein
MKLFDRTPALIGVVHLRPLPGAPRFDGDLSGVIAAARRDAAALAQGGCDAVIVENFGDVPFYSERVPPETIAAMALALAAVREEVDDRPLGVNVLRNDARAALGLCAATGADFMRVNVHTSAAVSDQGILQGHADDTIRERARIAPKVLVLADVHVKHATPLGDESAAEAAADAIVRGMADGVILTGNATGRPPSQEVLSHVRRHVGSARVLIGSGLSDANAPRLLESADGAIVGTWFKEDTQLANPVDADRVRRLRAIFDEVGEERPETVR